MKKAFEILIPVVQKAEINHQRDDNSLVLIGVVVFILPPLNGGLSVDSTAWPSFGHSMIEA